MLIKYKIDKEAAKKETWFHPLQGRTVCIADIADKMTDEEAEIFYKGGCKAIEKLPELPAESAAPATKTK
ncbi:hypothetical protein [Runella zeae]|uniref:hypothetical protein n=1 Tax=Runella zeae TaxID=94255 RepID=UPI002354C904|nr:hypothetical protein [Runella zeae]